MTREEIATKVKNLIVDHMNVDPERVTPSADLIDDLGADSLDLIELVMAAEEEFGLEIPDADAEKLMTVREATDYIALKHGVTA